MSQLFLKTQTAGYYMVQNANQLLYSQDFSNAVWVKTNATMTAGQTDPSAGTQAFTMTATGANATLLQTLTLDGTLNRDFSLYIKRKTGVGNIYIAVDSGTYVLKAVTGAWVRYDTFLAESGTVAAGIKIETSGDEVYIAWGQFEDGTLPTTYATNTANRYTVTQITDADYPGNTTRGCAFLDGRFFVMTPNGDIYQSALEDASSWNALDFIGSQIEPDSGVYLAKFQNYIAAFKGWSTEFFYDAANATGSILSPVQNASFKVGCASDNSVQEMAGTIVWMGQTRDGFGRSVFRLNGTAPERISNDSIEKILNADSLATVYSWNANVGSHMLYGLTLVTSGVSLCYDFSTQHWSFLTYLVSSGVTKTITAITAAGVVTSAAHGYSDGDIVQLLGTGDFDGWQVVSSVTTNTFTVQATGTAFSGIASCIKYSESWFPILASTRANGVQYMQHYSNGDLFVMDQTAYRDQVGAIAARARTPKFDGGSSKPKSMGEVELVGDKIDSFAMIRYTDDDFASFAGFRSVNLSANRSRISRLGQFSRRSFETLHVKNALLRLEALEIEVV
jgi:hypothetical protein